MLNSSGEKSKFDEFHVRLKEAERRILDHPAYSPYVEYKALAFTISAVFVANWQELLTLLDAAATDPRLAFELIQNVRRPEVRDRFQALTAQRLHNYVAGTMSLVDHVRRIMRGRDDGIAREFNTRRFEVANHPEIPFIQDLRNFTLHRQLPFLSHRFSITAVNTTAQHMESEVELGVRELLQWDKWSAASKVFLRAQGEVVVLRPLVRTHGELVIGVNNWLLEELAKANEAGLNELNELVVARNAVLTNGDVEKARRGASEWPDDVAP